VWGWVLYKQKWFVLVEGMMAYTNDYMNQSSISYSLCNHYQLDILGKDSCKQQEAGEWDTDSLECLRLEKIIKIQTAFNPLTLKRVQFVQIRK